MLPFQWTILGLSLIEVVLLGIVAVLFTRLRRSEDLLARLTDSQKELMDKLDFSEKLEKELVDSFSQRQSELQLLEQKLRFRAEEMKKLLDQAESFSRSPAFLRQTLLAGHARGKSVQDLARATGLATDEIELILEQHR